MKLFCILGALTCFVAAAPQVPPPPKSSAGPPDTMPVPLPPIPTEPAPAPNPIPTTPMVPVPLPTPLPPGPDPPMPTASSAPGGPICECGYTYCASVLMAMSTSPLSHPRRMPAATNVTLQRLRGRRDDCQRRTAPQPTQRVPTVSRAQTPRLPCTSACARRSTRKSATTSTCWQGARRASTLVQTSGADARRLPTMIQCPWIESSEERAVVIKGIVPSYQWLANGWVGGGLVTNSEIEPDPRYQ